MVKHEVKGEKWACSIFKAGKNKPIVYITKMRDFKRICEEIKANSLLSKLFLTKTKFYSKKQTDDQECVFAYLLLFKLTFTKFERVEFVLLAFIFVLFSGSKEKCKP